MNQADNFEIKYWAGSNEDLVAEQKSKRSIKRKLSIVFSFISILAIIPVLVFGLSNLNFNQPEKVSVIQSPAQHPQPTPTPQILLVEVINNDSYWKISKRHCGTGKYYLSIRDQNDGKPLYKGDSVRIDCSL